MADRPLTALALAKEWMALDQDPETRAEIQALLDSQDVDQLELLMSPRIGFGTAGLRGCMEAGFGRMNSLTVIQTSQGLAAYLLNNVIDANKKSVVIGRDHRHNSAKFIDLAAAAFTSMGIEVIYLGMVHTPLVPFTVKTMGATAGVMITASHNTAKDNGLKVYWSNACQIIPPHDAGIAAAIQRNLDPLSWDRDARKTSQLVENNNGKALEEYYKSVQKLVGTLDHSLNAAVFTTMHGVGGHYLTKVIERLIQKPSMPNIESPLIPVPEQVNPDPDFPTVKFPNPEEAGALNMAMKRADKLGIRSVIALDPDGDRFAAAEKLANDTWHQFTGNEMGVLLASYILEVQVPRARSVGNHKPLAMLNSTVSSRMLREMSEFHGFRHVETLTGFKWLGNTAQELERDGYWVPYAFEEAIGYMFTEVGHDKDGVAAAALYLAARGKLRRVVFPFVIASTSINHRLAVSRCARFLSYHACFSFITIESGVFFWFATRKATVYDIVAVTVSCFLLYIRYCVSYKHANRFKRDEAISHACVADIYHEARVGFSSLWRTVLDPGIKGYVKDRRQGQRNAWKEITFLTL